MPATAKLDVRLALDDIPISIDEINLPRNPYRTGSGVDEDFRFISHVYAYSLLRINRGSREVLVSAMGGATSTSSLIQSGEYVRG